jgi:hypothetical protein
MEVEVPRSTGRRRDSRSTNNPYQRKPRRILKPEHMQHEVTALIVDVQRNSNLIPCWKEILDLLGLISLVLEAERRYREWQRFVPSVQHDGFRQIRYGLETLLGKFGYTLKERRES